MDIYHCVQGYFHHVNGTALNYIHARVVAEHPELLTA